MDDASGWGPALACTIRTLHLHPELSLLYRRRNDLLTGDEADLVCAWRQEATRLGRFRSRDVPAKLAALLKCAAGWLESRQAELAAVCACRTSCPEFGWEDAPEAARDLYDAVRALSRTAGPEVMLTDRVAVDLIESMTGRRRLLGDRPGITRAKRWLEWRGYFAIAHMPGSRTTVYLVTQGTYPQHSQKCPVSLATGIPDTRPQLSDQDLMVMRQSREWLRAGLPWTAGRALAAVRHRKREHDEAVAGQWGHVRLQRSRPDPSAEFGSSVPDSDAEASAGFTRDGARFR